MYVIVASQYKILPDAHCLDSPPRGGRAFAGTNQVQSLLLHPAWQKIGDGVGCLCASIAFRVFSHTLHDWSVGPYAQLHPVSPHWLNCAGRQHLPHSRAFMMQVTKLSTPSATHAAEILGHVITWINENMQQVLNNRAPGVIADLENRFILMGHSGGGQITT